MCMHPQVDVAFEELSEDVRAQLTAEQEQKLETHVTQVLEAVDLDKFMDGERLTACACIPHSASRMRCNKCFAGSAWYLTCKAGCSLWPALSHVIRMAKVTIFCCRCRS